MSEGAAVRGGRRHREENNNTWTRRLCLGLVALILVAHRHHHHRHQGLIGRSESSSVRSFEGGPRVDSCDDSSVISRESGRRHNTGADDDPPPQHHYQRREGRGRRRRMRSPSAGRPPPHRHNRRAQYYQPRRKERYGREDVYYDEKGPRKLGRAGNVSEYHRDASMSPGMPQLQTLTLDSSRNGVRGLELNQTLLGDPSVRQAALEAFRSLLPGRLVNITSKIARRVANKAPTHPGAEAAPALNVMQAIEDDEENDHREETESGGDDDDDDDDDDDQSMMQKDDSDDRNNCGGEEGGGTYADFDIDPQQQVDTEELERGAQQRLLLTQQIEARQEQKVLESFATFMEKKRLEFDAVSNISWLHLRAIHKMNRSLAEAEAFRSLKRSLVFNTPVLTRLPPTLAMKDGSVVRASSFITDRDRDTARNQSEQKLRDQKTFYTSGGLLMNIRVKGKVKRSRLSTGSRALSLEYYNDTHMRISRRIELDQNPRLYELLRSRIKALYRADDEELRRRIAENFTFDQHGDEALGAVRFRNSTVRSNRSRGADRNASNAPNASHGVRRIPVATEHKLLPVAAAWKRRGGGGGEAMELDRRDAEGGAAAAGAAGGDDGADARLELEFTAGDWIGEDGSLREITYTAVKEFMIRFRGFRFWQPANMCLVWRRMRPTNGWRAAGKRGPPQSIGDGPYARRRRNPNPLTDIATNWDGRGPFSTRNSRNSSQEMPMMRIEKRFMYSYPRNRRSEPLS